MDIDDDHSPLDGPRRLALIEVEGRDGRVARTVDVLRWPLTVGRAIDNDVVVDDPHVAAHHLRIDAGADGTPTLAVLDTRNGVRLAGAQLEAGSAAPLAAGGAALTVGTTTIRLRLPGEVLAAERPLVTAHRYTGRQLAAMALVLAAVLWGGLWIALDPGVDASAWLPTLLGLPVALAAWCGAWALMSKLFQHRFDFMGHLRAALPWLLASVLVEALWPQLAAALAQPGLWQLGTPLQALLMALLLRAHLNLLLPAHQRAVAVTVALLLVTGGGISLTAVRRATDSYSAAPYMSTLPLPALRWAGTVPIARLADDIGPLTERLQRRVERSRRDDTAGDDEGSGD